MSAHLVQHVATFDGEDRSRGRSLEPWFSSADFDALLDQQKGGLLDGAQHCFLHDGGTGGAPGLVYQSSGDSPHHGEAAPIGERELCGKVDGELKHRPGDALLFVGRVRHWLPRLVSWIKAAFSRGVQ